MDQFLLQPISSLSRVGNSLSNYLEKLLGAGRVFDLLLHRPIRVEQISILPRIDQIINDELVILKGRVDTHLVPSKSRQPFRVICYNQSGYFNLVFFKIFPSQIAKLKINSEIVVLGKFSRALGENQIVHPYEFLPVEQIEKLPKLNVIYSLSSNISQKFLIAKIQESLSKINNNFEEWIDPNLITKLNFSSFYQSLISIHNPKNSNDFLPMNIYRRRLAYDELLAWQIAITIAKNRNQDNKNQPIINQDFDDILLKFKSNLPFNLTNSQLKAIKEINQEILSTKKMLRLLQGDVGSGKTIVAIHACLQALSVNKQSCIIAPTTVLAKQHFIYFKKLLEQYQIKIEILTSANTKKQKNNILKQLANAQIDILISTHAVLEDDVKFKNLGLAIIDEQHRFGVIQRLKLVEKGDQVDLLLMSATPIPRSLMMGLYGDMDISILNEKPKNRQEILTTIMSQSKSPELFQSIDKIIEKNEKVYWICPIIQENDNDIIDKEPVNQNSDLVSVEKKYQELINRFGNDQVAIIHGKMKESEKELVMNQFSNPESKIKILVATTVIEVGVDIANATVIVIENAENFGLAQLHQLRGRVGRSERKSFCILLYGKKYGEVQKQRLSIMKQSNDGFLIAEEDLKLRGSGDLIGTKQSGFPEFQIADLSFDGDLLKLANQQAKIIINKDQQLNSAINKKYHYLLKLFNYYDFLTITKSG